jgi:hypothetical protein
MVAAVMMGGTELEDGGLISRAPQFVPWRGHQQNAAIAHARTVITFEPPEKNQQP